MFLGLDISLENSGIVVIKKNYGIVDTVILSVTQKDTERLFHLENKFLNYIESIINKYGNIFLCCLEGYAYQEKGRVFEIGEWVGNVKLNLFKKGIPIIKSAPNQVKKYATGKGIGIKKNLMLLKVYQNFGEEFDNDNTCDAYVVARIAHDYYYKYIENSNNKFKLNLKKYQLDILQKINKSHNKKDQII